VEELQLVLTGTKTVYLAFQDPDQWHYTVATLAAETPDTAAADRSIQEQKPVGMIATRVAITGWNWIEFAPNLIGQRATVGGVDTYVVIAPTYPTWTSATTHFTTWADVVANNAH
jgi:hypothetical protein